MSREKLLSTLQDYKTTYLEEIDFKHQFLPFINSNSNCFDRDLKIGHVTGSAWIIDPYNEYALLTHHSKLDKWLQLGGHSDGNANVAEVALREAKEESGLKSIAFLSSEIFDIDIHVIPERNSEPEHLHYDIRYLLSANKNEPLQKNHESKALEWVHLSKIKKLVHANSSVMRMVEKSIALKTVRSSNGKSVK